MNKITLVTLGVKDIEASKKFYMNLGFEVNEAETETNIVIFKTGETTFSLYGVKQLAEDINAESPPQITKGFNGMALAYNTSSKVEVDELYAKVVALGAHTEAEPCEVFWGGYHFYFQDFDGYYWEVAYAY